MSNYRTTAYFKNPDGTHRRVTLRAETRRELEAKKMALKEKEKKGVDLANNSTFGYWANKWLKDRKLNQGLSRGTEDCYRSCVLQLNAEFENVQFRSLTMSRFQEFINSLAECNPKTGRPVSASYLRKIKSVAKSIALYANGSHVDGVTAFYNVAIPRTAPVKKVTALSEDQIQRVVEYPHEMQLFAMIGIFAGLRRGEILALQWKHIDLNHSTIHVVQSLNWTPNQPTVKAGAKTANSVRTVVVPPVLVSFLRDYKNSLAVYPAPQAYVCHNEAGKPYTQSEFRRRWDNYNKALNREYGGFSDVDVDGVATIPMKIEPMHTHQCRHTFATLCYLEGLSIADSMQELGHSSPQMTLSVYTDLANFHKWELSEDFQKKLQTSYRIPLNGSENDRLTNIG